MLHVFFSTFHKIYSGWLSVATILQIWMCCSRPVRNLCLLMWNCAFLFYLMLHIDSLWDILQVCAFAKCTVTLLLKVDFKFHTSILFKRTNCVEWKKLSILKCANSSLSTTGTVISVNFSLLDSNICYWKFIELNFRNAFCLFISTFIEVFFMVESCVTICKYSVIVANLLF